MKVTTLMEVMVLTSNQISSYHNVEGSYALLSAGGFWEHGHNCGMFHMYNMPYDYYNDSYGTIASSSRYPGSPY